MAKLASAKEDVGEDMSVKIKVMNTKGARVEVQVRRPKWQEFLQY